MRSLVPFPPDTGLWFDKRCRLVLLRLHLVQATFKRGGHNPDLGHDAGSSSTLAHVIAEREVIEQNVRKQSISQTKRIIQAPFK